MIRDKSIYIKNIYYMLSYAFQNLNQSEYEEVAKEDFNNAADLFAAIISKGLGRQLKQGLYREYIDIKEDSKILRGKIDLPGTLRNQIARKQTLSCEHDELSENNLYNQIIKTSAFYLLKQKSVSAERKSVLKKETLFLSNVDTIDPASIRWSSIRFSKNNANYRMLISICQLLLEGMLMTTDKGEYRLSSFIDDQHMSRLYEKFILEYYIKEHPEIKISASQIEWALDSGERTMLPIMQSDIMLSKGTSILIIDAKYYTRTTQEQYGKHTYHSNNLYQIFTYVKNKEAELAKIDHEPVSGMLLYAKTDEDIVPDASYQMSGNNIFIKTLDLNQQFPVIAEHLDRIAEDVRKYRKANDDAAAKFNLD